MLQSNLITLNKFSKDQIWCHHLTRVLKGLGNELFNGIIDIPVYNILVGQINCHKRFTVFWKNKEISEDQEKKIAFPLTIATLKFLLPFLDMQACESNEFCYGDSVKIRRSRR